MEGNRTMHGVARAVIPGARWLAKPGDHVRLKDGDAGDTSKAPGDKEETRAATTHLHDELIELQARLWAEHRRSVLVVFQAIDAGGKDGAIRHIFSGLNPAGVRVATFKRPTELEGAHDFLWRVHAECPAAGEIVVFNRSHYEDVLVTRVHALIDEATWTRRYEEIRHFEAGLASEGTTIVKFFLHISNEEQRERLQARVDSPDHRWKFSSADLPERERWDDYQLAFSDAIAATSTEAAPWYVIPADHKWYRDWAVTSTLHGVLGQLDPQYPSAAPGVEDLVVS